MWWQYIFVFIGAFIFDVVPFPFPPAFTIMIFFQIMFGLNIWQVIFIGVAGSILGRYVLTLYIPRLSEKYFKPSKNQDIEFLGRKLKDKGWKAQLVILAYSLLPLPTTPLFVAGGMAKIGARYIIPAFTIGKFCSDTVAVHLGDYASQNSQKVIEGIFTAKSTISLVLGLIFLFALLFIDWRTLVQKKKLKLNFRIFK